MSDRPKKDDAGIGREGGDLPVQPITPTSLRSGDADPRFDAGGSGLCIPTDDGADEAEGHPT